ncbi:MAG TPA: type II secretion system protein GspN [Bdellovibrionota bacterium]|nr:type II secretion system protein GspN [Bdellovibrionota bacterium]
MKFLPTKETLKAFAKYIALGSVVFFIGVVWNFPYERIRDTLTSSLKRQTGYMIDMSTLSPALPIGFKAANARVQGPPLGTLPVDIEFDELRITVSPFSLFLYPFRKSLSLSYSAERQKNVWSGNASLGKDEVSFKIKTKELKLKQSIPMEQINPLFAGSDVTMAANVGLSASLSGSRPSVMRGDLSAAEGKIAFTASEVTVKGPVVNHGFNTLRFDKVTLDARMQKGKLDVNAITLSGPDIAGTANGSLKIDPYFPRSQLRLESKLTISEKAKVIRDFVTAFGETLGIRMDPNGTFALRIEGPLTPIDRLSVRGY